MPKATLFDDFKDAWGISPQSFEYLKSDGNPTELGVQERRSVCSGSTAEGVVAVL